MLQPAVVDCDVTEQSREFLNTHEVAAITGLSEDTLNKMRSRNHPDSPPWFRVGTRCLYPRNQLRDWAAARIATVSGGAR